MKIDRIYWGLWFIASLLFVVWITTEVEAIFIVSAVLASSSYITFVIDQTKQRKQWLRETQEEIDARNLVFQAEMFLLENNAVEQGIAFRCPECNKVSFNRKDLIEGYCGNCHAFTAPPQPGT